MTFSVNSENCLQVTFQTPIEKNRENNLPDFYCTFLDFETNKRWHYIDLKIEVKVRIEKHFDRFAFASDGP